MCPALLCVCAQGAFTALFAFTSTMVYFQGRRLLAGRGGGDTGPEAQGDEVRRSRCCGVFGVALGCGGVCTSVSSGCHERGDVPPLTIPCAVGGHVRVSHLWALTPCMCFGQDEGADAATRERWAEGYKLSAFSIQAGALVGSLAALGAARG